MGGVMGGVTGGMKIEESLCLKGSAPSDGRDGALSFESQQKSENVISLSMSHAFFNTLYFQKRSLTGNSALSIWELTEISTTFLCQYCPCVTQKGGSVNVTIKSSLPTASLKLKSK